MTFIVLYIIIADDVKINLGHKFTEKFEFVLLLIAWKDSNFRKRNKILME